MRWRGRLGRIDGDGGFTLVEVLVSVAIIAVVMLGAGGVFVATASGTDAAGSRQVAARLATDGLDRVHALTPTGVNTGRDKQSVQNQWKAVPSAVTTLLGPALVTGTWDPNAAPGAGATAPLPTGPDTGNTIDGVTYTRSFFVNSCFLDTSQKCATSSLTGSVLMDNVAIVVTWPSKTCKASVCSYAVSTLMADSTTDPQFNLGTAVVAPVVTGLVVPAMDVTEALTGLRVSAKGSGPIYWSASGLPAGITIDAQTGALTGTLAAPTATGGTSVTVTATDAYGQAGQTTFTWTVNALPTLKDATAQLQKTLDLNTVLSAAGGTGDRVWKCTGLLPGLTVSADGILSGLAGLVTTVLTPACTITDSRGKTSPPATLTLTPLLGLTMTATTPTVTTRGTQNASVTTTTATNCLLGCTWSLTGAPAGLTIAATGAATAKVSGTVAKTTSAKTYPVTITVTDGLGRTATALQNWIVK